MQQDRASAEVKGCSREEKQRGDLEDVKANTPQPVHVGMIYFRQESNLRRRHRVLLRQEKFQLVYTPCIKHAALAGHCKNRSLTDSSERPTRNANTPHKCCRSRIVNGAAVQFPSASSQDAGSRSWQKLLGACFCRFDSTALLCLGDRNRPSSHPHRLKINCGASYAHA